MRKAIFPGSFDPLTNGHLDVIQRSAPLFDEIVIAVLNNPDKNPMFSVEERVAMIDEIVSTLKHDGCKITVASFSGLTAEFARRSGATAIVRGIRAVSDYEYELRMALMNRKLEPTIETVFLMAADKWQFVSSSFVKEIYSMGGDVSEVLTPATIEKLKQKYGER